MAFDIARLLGYGVVLLAIAYPLGLYMARVFSGQRTWLTPVVAPVERLVCRLAGIDPDNEMPWTVYAISLLLFNFACFTILYLMLRFQGMLPLNPTQAVGMSPEIAFNTAVSFVSNTNWQAYAGETSTGASHLIQMAGLTWQNFVSAGTGIAVAVALIRGLTRKEVRAVGNFWVDLTRAWLYVLLPIGIVLALVYVSQGVPQTLAANATATTVQGATQTISMGPVASQEAIKELGTNGGGFFNANSAHPFENPTPFSDWLQVLSILCIPAGLTFTFGKMAGNMKQGAVVFAAMALLFATSVAVMYGFEQAGNPNLAKVGADQVASTTQAGGNTEGKEVRFGIESSALYGSVTTVASNGAVNGSMSSMTPLSGGMAMLNIALGEVVFGGVGAGLYGMLIFAIIAVFIAGLMVGRTPEFLGKKIGPKEMKLAMFAVLALEAGILVLSAIAVVSPAGLAGRLSAGPHGLTEIMYAYTSGVGNNGSAFAGLSAGSLFYATTVGIAMLVGRYLFIIPVLAIAGSMGAKKQVPPSAGTFPTDTPLFTGLLVGVVVIVGALTFFPAYALGPILEQLLMHAGRLF
ncbi:MAG TPA: potassium-transporting ATPase subunit KdpA, partial [Candidatus Limnocylindrales bacterium]